MRTLLTVNNRLVGWIQPCSKGWVGKRVAKDATTKPKSKTFMQAKDAAQWVYGETK